MKKKNAASTDRFNCKYAISFNGLLWIAYPGLPLSINSYPTNQLESSILNEFDISSYVSTLTDVIVLASAIMFHCQFVVYFLGHCQRSSPIFEDVENPYRKTFESW